MITGKTKILGVIGHPIEHSLSPLMQNAAIAHLGVDYVYVPFAIRPENLGRALDGLVTLGVRGFNVTIPYKQAIMPYLTDISATAQLIGAVNTVCYTEQGWYGTNTDVQGFLAPLRAMNYNWGQIHPVILGHGGAARAVVVGCAELGCEEIHVVGRNKERIEEFYHSWENTKIQNRVRIHPWANLPELIAQSHLVVNTTPIGMYPHLDQSPIRSYLLKSLPEKAIAYDLVYIPRPTLFLEQARQKGAIIVDGLEMLIQQGAAALKLWLGQDAPVDIMRSSLLDYFIQLSTNQTQVQENEL